MLLPDITEYYSNDSGQVSEDQYKRKFVEELEVIGQCNLCGVLLDSECEIVVDDKETYCSENHKREYQQMREDGEINEI